LILRGRLLRRLVLRTQEPAFALFRPIRLKVPVAACRRGRIRRRKTIIRPGNVRWYSDAYAPREEQGNKRNQSDWRRDLP
jgi:hypothetical protein